MVVQNYELIWTKRSQQNMLTTYKYICKESELNAKKVMADIIKAAEKAIVNPELYPIDKYKENNDGSYRAFEKHKYRIAYRIKKNIILVLQIRHTKMRPKMY